MTLPRPKLIADHEFPQWDAFITQHPNGTIYHHSAWKEVIEKTYGYQPYYRNAPAYGAPYYGSRAYNQAPAQTAPAEPQANTK